MVYKPGKPSLRFELAVISLCQIAFLGYGLFTLWQSRPVFLVASEHRYNLVFANEIDAEQLAKTPRSEWRRLSWTGLQRLSVVLVRYMSFLNPVLHSQARHAFEPSQVVADQNQAE